MNLEKFNIHGPLLITLDTFADDRGFFVERFHLKKFMDLGLPTRFVQDNFSRSKPKTLRGLHYQWELPQGKLVTCLHGKIFDVAVDIRHNSPSYGQHISVELSGDKPQCFWIPPGFAHGFCVLGDEIADVMYKVDNLYNGKGESGIVWNDSEFKIKWPVANPLLSPKDAIMQTFADYKKLPVF